ncbi:MAG: cytochrome c3 family protein [Proteobacteria bacterium]|nr:cytochrome c3 family protein [Pseudomonadota bacterium]
MVVCGFGVVLSISSQAYGWWMWTPGDTVDDSTQNTLVAGYMPDQPVPFSHKLHAGDRQISCEYCHSGARRSASAVVPDLATCMGCHQVVAIDKEPIKLITEKYRKNEPLQWVKVNDLPDHVRFSHQPHVLAGVSCESCHGEVKEMEKVSQWAPLQMGWCIGCHKENNASISCQSCHY